MTASIGLRIEGPLAFVTLALRVLPAAEPAAALPSWPSGPPFF